MILVTGLILFTIGLELDTPRVVATLGLFAYALVRLMPLAGRVATNLASFRAGLPRSTSCWRTSSPRVTTPALRARRLASGQRDARAGRRHRVPAGLLLLRGIRAARPCGT